MLLTIIFKLFECLCRTYYCLPFSLSYNIVKQFGYCILECIVTAHACNSYSLMSLVHNYLVHSDIYVGLYFAIPLVRHLCIILAFADDVK